MAKITFGTQTDWDNTLTGKMINYSENKDSIAFDSDTQRWHEPDARKGYDPNQRGMGVDINKNQHVKPYLKQDKKGIYLTKEDEKTVRYKSIDDADRSYKERLKFAQKTFNSTNSPSELKKALTINAIYNLGPGTVANELFSDKALMYSLLNGSDNEYMEHIIRYFVKHQKKERPALIRAFVSNYQKNDTLHFGGNNPQEEQKLVPKMSPPLIVHQNDATRVEKPFFPSFYKVDERKITKDMVERAKEIASRVR